MSTREMFCWLLPTQMMSPCKHNCEKLIIISLALIMASVVADFRRVFELLVCIGASRMLDGYEAEFILVA